jgi:transcriptional regulator with XRE-family HTH domain
MKTTFAKRLRKERERVGMTQIQLKELLGVSFEAVSKWERGISVPSEIAQEGALARLRSQSGETV